MNVRLVNKEQFITRDEGEKTELRKKVQFYLFPVPPYLHSSNLYIGSASTLLSLSIIFDYIFDMLQTVQRMISWEDSSTRNSFPQHRLWADYFQYLFLIYSKNCSYLLSGCAFIATGYSVRSTSKQIHLEKFIQLNYKLSPF